MNRSALTIIFLSLFNVQALADTKITKSYDLPEFSRINIGGNVEVTVTSGLNQLVKLSGEKAVLSNLTVDSSGGELSIKCQGCGLGSWPWQDNEIKAEIQVKNLTAIELSGASKLVAKNISSDLFELEISGAGEAEVQGKTKSFEVGLSGAGKVKAYELISERVEADISGAGELEVFAQKVLEADVSGAGKLTYKGTPAIVKTDVSGVGQIEPRG